MKRVLALGLVLISPHALPYEMVVSNIVISAGSKPGTYGVSLDWRIEGGPSPSDDYMWCVTTGAKVCGTALIATVNGQGRPVSNLASVSARTIFTGTFLNRVYEQWIGTGGGSGHFDAPEVSWIFWPWGLNGSPDFKGLCFVFAGFTDSGVYTPMPGNTCYHASPPENTCRIQFPPIIDMGVVRLGQTASGIEYGSIACNKRVSVRARLLNAPTLDRNPVQISVNGHTLLGRETTIGEGSSIALRVSASVDSPLMHAGVYYTDSVISLSYD